MVLNRVASILAILTLAAGGLRAEEAPRPAQVTLPLADYLALVEDAERTAREAARREGLREAPLAEIVAQHTAVVVGEKDAEVSTELSVLVQGHPKTAVSLPFSGLATEVAVTPAGTAAAFAVKGGGLFLAAPAAGRYTVKAKGRAPLENRGGVSRFAFAPVLAPVATTEVDLPADLAWSAPGAVVVADVEASGRRKVRLAIRRGEAPVLEVRRKVGSGEADKLLAQSVVLTIVQLHPDGPRRHDVVLYEVARGGLSSFTVDVPAGLVVETAGTDEGDVVPVIDARRLTVHRRGQLTGTGYLVLTSSPAAGASLPLEAVQPETEVRARYVALSSSVAADARPLPEASWARVDLDDLPATLRDALSSLDLSAAWRLAGAPEGTALAVSMLPAAPSLESLVRLRETTTLLTVDGTVLHRERLTLDPSSGPGTALELALPADATLWSAQVDGQPVRPLERGGGRVAVPLGFGDRRRSVVEVIAVLDRVVPKGRSLLALDLPQLAVPVLEHRWRLLLPEGPRYRFRSGDLRPARSETGALAILNSNIATARDPWAVLQKMPGVLTDRVNVGGNESGQQSQYVGPGSEDERRDSTGATVSQTELEEIPVARDPLTELKELQQGLVSGVKPLAVAIPEDGKVLLLTGVLPPARVAVELDVQAKR